jgi:hypothetical protein
MKNSLKSAALIAFLLVPSMSKVAFGGEIPDCRDTPEVKYGKDSWIVTINTYIPRFNYVTFSRSFRNF